MSAELVAIQKLLTERADKNHADFANKMIPGGTKIYGVKTPELNIIVGKYKSGAFELTEELWASGALEEKIIAIKIMEKTGKKDPLRLLSLFQEFSGQIDNWAVCDGLGMQFLRGIVKTHAAQIFEIAKKLSRSKDMWQRRLSLVMVEWYTRQVERHSEIKRLVKNLEEDKEYYVKKAIVWINKNLDKKK